MKKFDLVVIGAGPSGYAAAMRALDFRKKILLVEKDRKKVRYKRVDPVPVPMLRHLPSAKVPGRVFVTECLGEVPTIEHHPEQDPDRERELKNTYFKFRVFAIFSAKEICGPAAQDKNEWNGYQLVHLVIEKHNALDKHCEKRE